MTWATKLNHNDDLVGAIHAWNRRANHWFSVCGLLTAARVKRPLSDVHEKILTFGCQLCARKIAKQEGQS